MTTSKRAIILLSVSSKRQVKADKVSMDYQREQCHTYCKREGFTIVDELQIPGLSRREADIVQLLEDFDRAGNDTYRRLRQHWQKKDFDLLVMYTFSRSARSSTGFSWVVENTILSGANVYFIENGLVTRENFRIIIGYGSMMAAGEVDAMVARRKPAMEERVLRGLPYSRPPLSHKVVYDERTGRPAAFIVDPDKRRLLDDIYTLFVGDPQQGINPTAFDIMETELYQRFGHSSSETGRQYSQYSVRKLFYNPVTWGHAALYFSPHRYKAWVYDESETAPKGVICRRNSHEAAWTGEQAAAIKAELRRRENLRGNARPVTSYLFTGLIVCGECGKAVIGRSTTHIRKDGTGKTVKRYICDTRSKRKSGRPHLPDCRQGLYIREDAVQGVVQRLLDMLEAGVSLEEVTSPQASPSDTLSQLEKERAQLQRQIARRIADLDQIQSEALRSTFLRQIDEMGVQLDALQKRQEAQASLLKTAAREQYQRDHGLTHYRNLGRESFWQQSATFINQTLRQIFGEYRLLLLDAKIISISKLEGRVKRDGSTQSNTT